MAGETFVFKQIKVRHISEEVFDQIKSAILQGKLKPGDRLPAERKLMRELGVSRIPIREALKLLSNTGLIDTRQGGGSYVRSLSADRVRDPLHYIVKDNVEGVFELLEVRREIESWSAYYGSQRATAAEIDALRHIVEETKTCCDREETPPTRLDADFHLAVARCSHNAIRVHLTCTIYDVFAEYLKFLTGTICFSKEYQRTIYGQHLDISNAIGRRDAETARDAVREHLAFVEEALRKQVSTREMKTSTTKAGPGTFSTL